MIIWAEFILYLSSVSTQDANYLLCKRMHNEDNGGQRLQHPVMDLYFHLKINNRIEIDLQNEYDLTDCNDANNYEFLPAVKIARLTVVNRYKIMALDRP